jgi:hypothetical protein
VDECQPLTGGLLTPEILLAPLSPLAEAMRAETLYGVILDVRKEAGAYTRSRYIST